MQDSITFQAVLYAGGEIQINYQDLEDSGVQLTADNREAEISGGVSATVALWNGTPDIVPLPAGKFVPGLHSLFGSNNLDFEGNVPESNDRYVRLAWDTGGAAWDLGVVEGRGDTGPSVPTIRTALRDQFFDSLGNQILRQEAAGEFFVPDVPLLEVNVGGPAIGTDYVSDAPYVEGFTDIIQTSGGTTIDLTSNSISTNTPSDVFHTARVGGTDFVQIRSESGVTSGAEDFVATGRSILFSTSTPQGSAIGPSSFGYFAEQITASQESFSGSQKTLSDLTNAQDGSQFISNVGDFTFTYFGSI